MFEKEIILKEQLAARCLFQCSPGGWPTLVFGFLNAPINRGCPILCGFQRMGFCAVHSESDYRKRRDKTGMKQGAADKAGNLAG